MTVVQFLWLVLAAACGVIVAGFVQSVLLRVVG